LRSVESFQRVARALSEQTMMESEELEQMEAYGARLRATGTLD
jgi:hypothetical protein